MPLTRVQVDAAIDYDVRQGYCVSEIKLTQKTVGAVEDGKWGPETVQKVADWQPTQGLKPDGKVGPATWSAIVAGWQLVPAPPPVPTPRAQVGCGLAAYDQTFPGHTPEEALDKAFDTAVAEGCKEIRFWSTEWLIEAGLPGGGGKGNAYSGPWLAERYVPLDVIIGAWVDDPVRTAKSEAFVEALLARQVRHAALMINRSNTRANDVPWALRWTPEDLREIAALYARYGVDIIATCWPRPSKAQIDAMLIDMAWILPTLNSQTFEVDTESNWSSKFLAGFTSMRQAAEYLRDGMRALVGADGTLELTTFTYHVENSKDAVLAPLMDRLLPQAYSVRHRGNDTVDFDGPLGPGRHQELAIGRARQAAAA